MSWLGAKDAGHGRAENIRNREMRIIMSKSMAITFLSLSMLAAPLALPSGVAAKEFKVSCNSLADCISKGDKLTKRRKLSLAQEAYRNAIKLDVNNKDAWRKFEILTIRISEEGGCG